MQYLVNATFLINSSKSDISFIEDLELKTTELVLDEVALEIGLNVDIVLNIEHVSQISNKTKIPISKNKLRLLSSVDKNLLLIAFERKKKILLITDDKQIRIVAKENRIRCLNTPQFVAYLAKHSEVSIKDAVGFLMKLRSIYIRPKDIDSVLRRMERWK